MKYRIITSIMLLFLLSTGLWADSSSLSYVEGQVTIEKNGGNQKEAAIGDSIQTGDTIYTGRDGFAEISMDSGSTISIQAGTVFNVGEVSDPELESRKRGFFRVLLGSVGFKFRNLTREPDVGTPLAVCSVRGTDFTVYTAPDGASMTVVSDGLVEVTSGGESALLAADEGVEVIVGLGLGESFDAKYGFVRYDAFVKQSLQQTDLDVLLSLGKITEQLKKYAEEGAYFLSSWNLNYEEVNKARLEMDKVRIEEGDESADKVYEELLIPIQKRSLELNQTYRFNLISGLYLRRFVLSNYYTRFRTRFLSEPENPEWLEFLLAYESVTDMYENELIPLLEDEDL